MRAMGAILPQFFGFGHPPRKILDPPLAPGALIRQSTVCEKEKEAVQLIHMICSSTKGFKDKVPKVPNS